MRGIIIVLSLFCVPYVFSASCGSLTVSHCPFGSGQRYHYGRAVVAPSAGGLSGGTENDAFNVVFRSESESAAYNLRAGFNCLPTVDFFNVTTGRSCADSVATGDGLTVPYVNGSNWFARPGAWFLAFALCPDANECGVAISASVLSGQCSPGLSLLSDVDVRTIPLCGGSNDDRPDGGEPATSIPLDPPVSATTSGESSMLVAFQSSTPSSRQCTLGRPGCDCLNDQTCFAPSVCQQPQGRCVCKEGTLGCPCDVGGACVSESGESAQCNFSNLLCEVAPVTRSSIVQTGDDDTPVWLLPVASAGGALSLAFAVVVVWVLRKRHHRKKMAAYAYGYYNQAGQGGHHGGLGTPAGYALAPAPVRVTNASSVGPYAFNARPAADFQTHAVYLPNNSNAPPKPYRNGAAMERSRPLPPLTSPYQALPLPVPDPNRRLPPLPDQSNNFHQFPNHQQQHGFHSVQQP